MQWRSGVAAGTVTAVVPEGDPVVTTPDFTIDLQAQRVTRQGADIHLTPDGQYLYVSNRGHDSIAVFAIDADQGTLTHIDNVPTQGKIPRSFEIDPTGHFLLAQNQKSDNIVIFRIDQNTVASAAIASMSARCPARSPKASARAAG